MDENASQSLFDLLADLGAIPKLVLLLAAVCTAWLVVSRVRSCFRARVGNVGRDLAFLSTGPVAAMLVALLQVATGAELYIWGGGEDIQMGLLYGLREAAAVCLMGMICFILGICSFMLPAKAKTAEA